MAKADKHEDLLREARERAQRSATAETDNRECALDSIKFGDGDQWPDEIKAERNAEGRPMLVNNKLRKFIKQVSGDLRKNRPAISIRPVDSEADVAGAEVRQDLIRQIEYLSNADHAYNLGGEQMLDGGYGFWRIITEFEQDGFNQDIKIKRIPNRFTVYLDPSAQEITYEDGNYAFVSEFITRKEFDGKYPGVTPLGFTEGQSLGESYEGWYEEDKVRIAEYFYKEYQETEIVQLSTGEVIELKDGIDEKDLEMAGFQIVKRRKSKSHKVMWCKISGDKILEGPKEFPSKYIPIVPVIGIEVNIEGKKHYRSLIHDAKDPMRMYNYLRTYEVELIALAPKAPYIGTPKQFEGHEQMWKDANRKNYPYLVYNDIPGVTKPSRERQVDIPTAVVNAANESAADIMDTIGRYEASLGQSSNERSGRAVLARKAGGDASVYTFVDNFNIAVIFTGQILLDMIPRVYDTERVVRLRGSDGKEKAISLNRVILDYETMLPVTINDMTVGKYDFVVTTGPTYQTKRQEIAASMLDFVQFVPQAAPVIGPHLAEVMDWPGAQEIAQELKMLTGLPPGGGGAPSQRQSEPGMGMEGMV